MFLWVFGILIIHLMESMTSLSTSDGRDYINTIGMMCAHNQTESGYFYTNIDEKQVFDLAWNQTFRTDRKVIFYVQGYGEDMNPEGEKAPEGDGKMDSYARVAQASLFDRRSMICLFDYKHKKNLGLFGSIFDFRYTALNRVPFVAKILKALAVEMFHQNVFSTFEDFEMIGFSMGAHIAGTVARMIKSELGHEIPRIFALEPARTLLNPYKYEIRRSDARYIQAIYTSSVSKQDIDLHCKVFVNDGANQKGCEGNYLMAKNFCNHCYLTDLYDDISMKTTTLVGYMDPDRNGEHYIIGAVLVGHQLQVESHGVYYANTDGSKLKKKWLG